MFLPLFHCHGLIATVLAALAAGAGVVCTAGCDVNNFFRMAARLSSEVVLGRSDHASGNSRPSAATSRASRELSPPSHPLRIRPAAAARLRGTGTDVGDDRDRIIRHDGNRRRADCMQSAAAAPAQTGFGRHTGGIGRRDHGRRRGHVAPWPDRTGGHPWCERHAGLRSAIRRRHETHSPVVGSRQATSVFSTTTVTFFWLAAAGR